MARLAQTPGLTDVQRDILGHRARRSSTRRSSRTRSGWSTPTSTRPTSSTGMREMGLFGLTIAEEYGGLGESLLTYALVVEELSRGWMSISGIVNTHFIVAYLIAQHGSAEQKARLLPQDGHRRGARRVLDVRARVRLGRGRASGPRPCATATRSSSMDRRCG